MNALKHGNRSKKVELLREESYSFENRLRKWMTIGDAQNDVEEYLVYRNVSLSFDLDRADRARLQRYESLIENADELELARTHEIGARLFFDPCGATPLYGNPQSFNRTKKTSWNHEAVNPNDPAALVRSLERSEAGCRFLLDRWQELRRQLEPPNFFQSHDRLKAIRLLGREPVQAIEDRRVCEIFVASHGLNPVRKNEFDDLLSDLDDEQRVRYRKALVARWPDLFRARETDQWRQILLDLVDRNIELLNARLEAHEENADVVAEKTFALLSFDPSPEGAALRNHQMKCLNALFRGMDHYRKHKSRAKNGGNRAGGPGRHETQRFPSADTRGEAQDGDDPSLRSFVPEDGHRERLEPAVDLADWLDRAPQPGSGTGETTDEVSGIVGAGFDESLSSVDSSDLRDREPQPECGTAKTTDAVAENETNEPDFDTHVSIAQEQDSVEVMANSGAQSGLDNGVVQPGEASEPEQPSCGTGESTDAISEDERVEARFSENVRAVGSDDLPDREPQPECGTAKTTDAVAENETNEPDFDTHVSIAQEQDSVEVMANSGVQSGLDNGVVQPGEASEPEQAEERKSESEVGNPPSQKPDADDPPGGGRSPAKPSRNHKALMRFKKEHKQLERMLDNMLAKEALRSTRYAEHC